MLITDVFMPRISGVALARWLWNISPETSVLFITAFGEIDLVNKAIRPEMDDYCRKPMSPEKMMDIVSQLAEKRINLQGRKKY